MWNVWLVGLTALWGVVLVDLLLTLRVVRWLRAIEDMRKLEVEMEEVPELSTGVPAPSFRAKSLSGEPITLADYAGRAVVFVFMSPRCGPCRHEMPMLIELAASKRQQSDLVVVSDQGTAETYAWIDSMHKEDGLEINLPILVAPRSTSEFLASYNPRGLTPYFCQVDEQGLVRACGTFGTIEWDTLRKEWEGSPKSRPFPGSHGRYR